MYELTVETSFSAAHCLEKHPSPCGRLHGHNWTVAVTVTGDELNTMGMVVDFAVLKQALREAVAVFDHRYLNELPPFCDGAQPTAENIARHIWGAVAEKLAAYASVTVKEIKIAESPSAWVVYRP
ncbi:MAG: 6-carboxytetrahydropterin synthase QueD [Ammonifex sp.]|jgi:6-pyruvoyltetrahydropterin/6-carboxytetrahydropterin synthase|nr:MAG: 6-carboxytetrahydropterin synthase QueD [Ammonifex sp.]